MRARFCKISLDLFCCWEGIPPDYRIYVNDELFSERSYVFTDAYLEEVLQVHAPPGIYRIRLEALRPNQAKFEIRDSRVSFGAAVMRDRLVFEIPNEEPAKPDQN